MNAIHARSQLRYWPTGWDGVPKRTLIVARGAVSVKHVSPLGDPARRMNVESPNDARPQPADHQYWNRTSPTTDRLMMSPNTCCWMSWFSRLVTFTSVVTRPCIHFTPKLPLTIVNASVNPWYGLLSTSLQNAESVYCTAPLPRNRVPSKFA